MGYTHYWYRKDQEINAETFQKIVKDFRKILKPMRFDSALGMYLDLGDGMGENKPVINGEVVIFNGRKSKKDDYETFLFPRVIKNEETSHHKTEEGLFFDCCKTAQRNYDIAVQIFLIIAKQYLQDRIFIKSDGDVDLDWADARALTQVYLRYGLDFKLD